MSISNEKKSVIHVAKQQLHMADEAYRALLARAAGVSSSAQLDEAGFAAVMTEFERLGFRSVRSRTQAGHRAGMASPAQLGRIIALWKRYSGNYDDLRLGRWLEVHFHVSHVRFLEGGRAGKCIAVLEKMAASASAKRAEGKAAPAPKSA
jgi:hypothetical protein